MLPSTAVRVALVQPPFGSGILPGLGLALLKGELLQRGLECRIFYWDLDLLAEIPGRTARERFQGFSELTSRPWFPFNEWVFAQVVHDDRLDHRAEALTARLRPFARSRRNGEALAEHLLGLRRDAPAVVDRCVDQLAAYDVVGIGTTFLQNTAALALARRVKQRWPHKTVVLGGANCDGEMGAALLEHFPFLDHVFSGEVDFAFPAFVQALAAGQPAGDVPGLISRDGAGRVTGTPAPPLGALDALAVPDYEDYTEAFHRHGLDGFLRLTLSLESSRGCWWGERHHCTFCGLNAGGMAFRRKSPERFEAEVDEVVRRYGVRYLYMADNILAVDYYGGLLERMRPRDVEFFYEIKSNVTRRQVASLAAGHVSYVKPGIEHFSSAILARMRKGVTGIQNVALLRLAREYGVLVDYGFLVNFPGEETEEYDRLALELPRLSHLRPPVALTPIEFHRFSPYHQDPAQFGLALRPWREYAEIYPLPEDQVARVAYVFESSQGVPPDFAHLRRLLEQVRRWHALYDEQRCTLVWEADGDDVVVDDTRPGFGPRRYRVSGFAVEVLRLLDEPKPLLALSRAAAAAASAAVPAPPPLRADETAIHFDAGAFRADPEACLAPLREAGLLFEEALSRLAGSNATETYALALPVPRAWRPANLDWLVY
ncbi:MAG: RiPP maturation radical SAM C-methyltransferase [Vicinamibacteria bacterium]|nr:RiPP maturation radical SAM C-methyltransferase [Vicinamibacteria bacterium]